MCVLGGRATRSRCCTKLTKLPQAHGFHVVHTRDSLGAYAWSERHSQVVVVADGGGRVSGSGSGAGPSLWSSAQFRSLHQVVAGWLNGNSEPASAEQRRNAFEFTFDRSSKRGTLA